jgi:hypothetical protein
MPLELALHVPLGIIFNFSPQFELFLAQTPLLYYLSVCFQKYKTHYQ